MKQSFSKTQKLQNTMKGSCIVVGHGNSIDIFDWSVVKFIPKILVNFYDPNIPYVIAVTVWDKDVHKDVYNKIKNEPIWLFSSAEDTEQPYDFFLPDNLFPVYNGTGGKVFSGPRAIFLAQYMGFKPIYLVGMDFIPHTDKKYYVRKKEVEHEDPSDITKNLRIQLNNFKEVKWIHDEIYTMNNNDSKLHFPFKLPKGAY